MDPLSLMAGGLSLIGNLFSSSTAAKQSQENTQMQIAGQEQMQKESERYNTEMSNTAYQRAKQDMMAAGLNPMMMASGGMAASSPSVSTPSMPTPQTTATGAGVGKAIDSALSSAMMAKTYDKMVEEISNLRVQEARTAAETVTEKAKPSLLEAEEGRTRVQTGIGHMTAETMRPALREADAKMKIPDWLFNTFVQGGYLGKKAGDAISPATDVLSSATGAGRLFKDIWRDRVDRGY